MFSPTKCWPQVVIGRKTYYNILNNIFIRFGSIVYRQIVGVPMGTYCAPHARIQAFLSGGGVQVRLPESSPDNVFLSPQLIWQLTVGGGRMVY